MEMNYSYTYQYKQTSKQKYGNKAKLKKNITKEMEEYESII